MISTYSNPKFFNFSSNSSWIWISFGNIHQYFKNLITEMWKSAFLSWNDPKTFYFKNTCKYFLLKHQCLGTGTVFLVDLRWTSSLGSLAVTSCISTTSGRVTSCFNSATLNLNKRYCWLFISYPTKTKKIQWQKHVIFCMLK